MKPDQNGPHGSNGVCRFLLAAIWCLCSTAASCLAYDVNVYWDANTETDIAGYKVYYAVDSSQPPFAGTGLVNGPSPVDVQNQTTATIRGLDPSRTYYFAVTAYNTSGLEGEYSNIVVSLPDADTTVPTITAFTIPTTSASLTVPITSLTAADNVAVTGYLLSESAQSPTVASAGWGATAPTTFTFSAEGARTLYAWVRDAAGNISAARSSTVTITLPVEPPASFTLWPSTALPATVDGGADDPVELGVKFRSDNGGTISGIRFYKAAANNGTHTARLWSAGGALLGTASFTGETASGWQQADFATPLTISANTVYIASYHTANGHYSFNQNYFSGTGTNAPPLHALADGVSGANGVYGYGPPGTFPNGGWFGSNYWVDVVFTASSTGDTAAPVVNTFTIPATSATLSVPITSLTATDNTAVTAYLVTESSTVPLASDSRWSVNAPTSFTFGSPGSKTLYAWARDAAGNVSAGKSATVTISGATGSTLWPSTALPATVDGGADDPVELGVKFRSDTGGTISGIRFYKAAANNGTHTARLWSAGGALLGTASFTGETASGWQQADFATPLTINANTVYIASYHTANGHYSFNQNYFNGTGTSAPPLHALADGVSGANGVYGYGPPGTFPNGGWLASNYWVDAVFTASSMGDTALPVVNTFTIPATSATLSVPITSLTATDNTAVTAYLVTESSAVPLASDSRWSVNAPTSFTFGSPGSKTLYAWARDAAGNVSAAKSATVLITLPVEPPANYTLWPSTTVPMVIDAGPDSAVQLGVKFTSDTSGFITGIRFYKSVANTGTHVGSLWTTSGQRLAVATFTNESGSGWQQANFSAPVPITANTVYIASYHTTVGHYSETTDYFSGKGVDNSPLHALSDGASGANSVYSYGTSTAFPNQTWRSVNYWVDVVFVK